MTGECILVGAFHEIIELAEESKLHIIGLIDNTRKGKYRGYIILGSDVDSQSLFTTFGQIPLIITPDLPQLREKLFNKYSQQGYGFCQLISTRALISPSARIGNGTVVQSMVNVSSESSVGAFVKLNTGCNIMHEAVIGDFTTVAPNAVILGNVIIGRHCYIGANSTILPGIVIGDDIVVGAGSVVTRNLNDSGKYAGVPAKKID